ncbi:MAG: 4Fe-4S ferredoxin iron-sulfur binding domain protein [Sphaerisporangium sp.]|nr:4Fe-4S ferredoxin iron-sulfur binding domain protein [Sphaerisporangium sp.]
MLCARECPDWCIFIDSHKETAPAPEGGRPRAHNVLDRFAIDFSLCMYCGICIEVCPFDALFWSPEFEYAEYDIRNLLHEKDRLGEWVQTIPVPPPHEPNAEPPKEVAAASRPARERPGPARGPAEPPGPGKSGQVETPRTGDSSHAAVRAIRPPGALPKKPRPAEGTQPPQAPGSPAEGTGPRDGEEPPESSGSVEES